MGAAVRMHLDVNAANSGGDNGAVIPKDHWDWGGEGSKVGEPVAVATHASGQA